MPKKNAVPTSTGDYLEPIFNILNYIDECYSHLAKLLDVIPKKLKKSEDSLKVKLKKAKEKQKKVSAALKDTKAKKKAKPTTANIQRVERQTDALAEIKAQVVSLTEELAPITEQLKMCMRMKKEHMAISKAVTKTEKSFARKNTAKAKKSIKTTVGKKKNSSKKVSLSKKAA